MLAACRAAGVDEGLVAERCRLLAGRVEERRRAWRDEAARAEVADAIPPMLLAYELERALGGRRWTLAAGSLGGWERRLWRFERHRQHLGWHGGGGLGYNAGAAIGAALALDSGTLCVCIQPDGDLLFTPGALWTAAHMSLPVLFVMHNNRQYENTVGHAARLAEERGRPVERRYDGSGLGDPPVDFATLARSFGVWGAGPVTSVEELHPALDEALAVVESGKPALVDVVTTGS